MTEVQAGTTVQWGVRRTWPDGHRETSSSSSRHSAEIETRANNSSRIRTTVAEVVSRTVTHDEWQDL